MVPSSSSSSCHARSDSCSGPHHQARAQEQPRATHTCKRRGYIGICFGDTHFKHICKLFPVNSTQEAPSTTKENRELTAPCACAKKLDETKELPTPPHSPRCCSQCLVPRYSKFGGAHIPRCTSDTTSALLCFQCMHGKTCPVLTQQLDPHLPHSASPRLEGSDPSPIPLLCPSHPPLQTHCFLLSSHSATSRPPLHTSPLLSSCISLLFALSLAQLFLIGHLQLTFKHEKHLKTNLLKIPEHYVFPTFSQNGNVLNIYKAEKQVVIT